MPAYTRTAKVLHWLIALAILVMLVLGWVMVEEGLTGGEVRGALFMVHKSLGITILVLSLFRLGWRLAHRPPPFLAGTPVWEKWAAGAVHWAFYGLMLALPLSGWALSSAASRPVSWFNLFIIPALPITPSEDTAHFLSEMHENLVGILVVLLVLHVGAALKHHFINRDGTFRRMLF